VSLVPEGVEDCGILVVMRFEYIYRAFWTLVNMHDR
jgi:hypothetical protein